MNDIPEFDRAYSIDQSDLFRVMSDRLAHAMHEFNTSNHPRQLYWNGYHQALTELHGDLLQLLQEKRS